MATLRSALNAAADAAEASELKRSKVALNPRLQPATNMGRVFAVAIESKNGGGRDRSDIVVAHTFSVRFVQPLAKSDQFDVQVRAVEIAESIVLAMMRQNRVPKLQVRWEKTQHVDLPGGEYLYTAVDFAVGHTLAIDSANDQPAMPQE